MKKRSKVPGVYTWGCRMKGGLVLSTSTYGPNHTDKCFAEQQSYGIISFSLINPLIFNEHVFSILFSFFKYPPIGFALSVIIYLISTLIFKVIFIYPIGSGYNCQLVFPLTDQFLIKLQTSLKLTILWFATVQPHRIYKHIRLVLYFIPNAMHLHLKQDIPFIHLHWCIYISKASNLNCRSITVIFIKYMLILFCLIKLD